ncbi:MAG TPA: hypothetical protein PKD90_19420, partial [Phnomibacter sp.]|nr:hypothetical protein [Phnomibacter sp.]
MELQPPQRELWLKQLYFSRRFFAAFSLAAGFFVVSWLLDIPLLIPQLVLASLCLTVLAEWLFL